jgi:hypothetical protein
VRTGESYLSHHHIKVFVVLYLSGTIKRGAEDPQRGKQDRIQ